MDCSQWVDDFLVYLAADRACSARTVELYGIALHRFEAFFGTVDGQLTWATVDGDVVRRWTMALIERGTATSSVKRNLSALRSFYRYLKLTQRTTHNPMLRVTSPKGGKPLPKFFRDDDINRLLDTLRDSACGGGDGETAENRYKAARAYLIILILYMTGVRVNELVGLDVGDIDLGAQQLRVTGKRNKQRVVPMTPDLTSAVRDYLPLLAAERARLAAKGGDVERRALLVSGQGRRMSVVTVEALVRKLTATVTSQQKRSPHVFRHTFATSMINNGSDLQSVKNLLGHASLATTEVYTHTNFKELQRIYGEAHPRA